mgnify:CR=1 FL=1
MSIPLAGLCKKGGFDTLLVTGFKPCAEHDRLPRCITMKSLCPGVKWNELKSL